MINKPPTPRHCFHRTHRMREPLRFKSESNGYSMSQNLRFFRFGSRQLQYLESTEQLEWSQSTERFFVSVAENDFSRADESEIQRVKEQDNVLPFIDQGDGFKLLVVRLHLQSVAPRYRQSCVDRNVSSVDFFKEEDFLLLFIESSSRERE